MIEAAWHTRPATIELMFSYSVHPRAFTVTRIA